MAFSPMAFIILRSANNVVAITKCAEQRLNHPIKLAAHEGLSLQHHYMYWIQLHNMQFALRKYYLRICNWAIGILSLSPPFGNQYFLTRPQF